MPSCHLMRLAREVVSRRTRHTLHVAALAPASIVLGILLTLLKRRPNELYRRSSRASPRPRDQLRTYGSRAKALTVEPAGGGYTPAQTFEQGGVYQGSWTVTLE
jgi:hypothetical protein